MFKLSQALTLLSLMFFSSLSISNSYQAVHQQYNAKPRYSFAHIGQFKLKDSTIEIGGDEGETYAGDLDDLPFFSGGVQQIAGGSWIRYGWEGGAILSWQNDSVTAYSNGGSTHIRIDNSFFMFGTFLGALIDIPLGKRVRIFASAGPSLSYADLSLKEKNDNFSASLVYQVNEHETEFGLGYYGAAGILISPEKNYEIGLIVRESRLGLDFSSNTVESVYEGRQYALSFGARL